MATDSQITAALRKVTESLPGGGEERGGQLEMALAAGKAIETKRHLVVQAGTGTGKSVAYLVPALLSGKKVVVATATKALQDQLAKKDLPMVLKHLPKRAGRKATFAVLKGRSNYLCLQKASEAADGSVQSLLISEFDDSTDNSSGSWTNESAPSSSTVSSSSRLGDQVLALRKWAESSKTGDRAELSFEPSPAAWAAVSATSSECPGAKRCPRGEDCFAESARRVAGAADVVVVNTHLYGAHLASGGAVLGEHEVLIIDEAHEFEDIASASLGVALYPSRFAQLCRIASHVLGRSDKGVSDLNDASHKFEDAIAPWVGQRLPDPLPDDLTQALTLAATRTAALEQRLRNSQASNQTPNGPFGKSKSKATKGAGGGTADNTQARNRAVTGLSQLREDLITLAALSEKAPKEQNMVAWVEGERPAFAGKAGSKQTGHPGNSALKSAGLRILKTAPIEVGPLLAKSCWPSVTAILTSATIPAGMAQRLGLKSDSTTEFDAGSPFDYQNQALLYCAAHLPDRRRQGSDEPAMHELQRLIESAGGRTLALFTSWASMTRSAQEMSHRLPYRILIQGDLPKAALLSEFSHDETSCLFATMGFWQGVDVPGRTCSMVVLDKIPFPRPDDPLLSARRDKAGPKAFREVDLPRAATALAQGAGRLLRNGQDCGVVAILDPRLATASYRWDLVRALPPMSRTRDFGRTAAYLKSIFEDTPRRDGLPNR